MIQCVNEFANYSTTRDGALIKRRLREKLSTLHAIAEVERYTATHEDDEIGPFLDDNFSGDGLLDFSDEQSSSIKRKLHTTLAGATVGKKQVRHADKRQHQPTNRFGDNVAVKDRHVVYATESRSLQRNRELLMLPGAKSTSLPTTVASVPPLFPENVNAMLNLNPTASFGSVLPASANDVSVLATEVEDSQLANVVEGIHQQNAEVASSMSSAPFAVGYGEAGNDPDDSDNNSLDPNASDYGSNGDQSGSSSVRSDYDNDIVNNVPPLVTMHLSYGMTDITVICSRPYLSLATCIARPEQQSTVFLVLWCSHPLFIRRLCQRCYLMLMMRCF
jgi:hypothetical protein